MTDSRKFFETSAQFMKRGPYALGELLVSQEPWPFETIDQLAEKFGKVPVQYAYWQLVEWGQKITTSETNAANNVICIPKGTWHLLSARYDLTADEFDVLSLRAWLAQHSIETNRRWAFQVLADVGILRPEQEKTPSTLPTPALSSIGKLPTNRPEPAPEIADWLDQFVDCAVQQYAAEIDESGRIDDAIQGKKQAVNALDRTHGRRQLERLLAHADPGVQVSAATYLAKSVPKRALPVLHRIAAGREAEASRWAERPSLHAMQTLWAYEDGLLEV